MSPTPTLDPQRTEQIRTFLVTEAAASVADRQPVLTPARRRVLVGAAAVLVLGGAFVAAEAVGGPAPAAIAIEVDGEWTTVRIADIDADPDAVVAELVAAGFAAERQTLDAITVEADGGATARHEVDASASGAGVVAFAHGEEGGAHGLVGLSVSLPQDALLSAAPPVAPEDEGRTIETDPVPAQTGPGGVSVVEPDVVDADVRFEDDGGVSLRRGTDATIIVYAER